MSKVDEVGAAVMDEALKWTGEFKWKKSSPDERAAIIRKVGTAAIEAMREATYDERPDMEEAGRKAFEYSEGELLGVRVRHIYKCMINAALNE